MTKESLIAQKCIPCEGGTLPFNHDQIEAHLEFIDKAWQITDIKLTRKFKFKNFKESMAFINKVADLAESEGHHPDISINYNRVIIELTTHAIGGLSKNDFIMAAKIDEISKG